MSTCDPDVCFRITTVEAVITNDATGKLIAKGTFTFCMMEELKVAVDQFCS